LKINHLQIYFVGGFLFYAKIRVNNLVCMDQVQ